jgi:hypothetical protein
VQDFHNIAAYRALVYFQFLCHLTLLRFVYGNSVIKKAPDALFQSTGNGCSITAALNDFITGFLLSGKPDFDIITTSGRNKTENIEAVRVLLAPPVSVPLL